MPAAIDGRWPPVYDADDLARVIKGLAADDYYLTSRFWDLKRIVPNEVFQGDVVRLPSQVPVIDGGGEAALTDDCNWWMVTGNTCDFARSEVDWTQLVPLVDLLDVEAAALTVFKRYSYYRGFYVPSWPGGDAVDRYADFTRPVTVHKSAFNQAARVVARMQYSAWALLHSCLVRFLARDDGRNDPA